MSFHLPPSTSGAQSAISPSSKTGWYPSLAASIASAMISPRTLLYRSASRAFSSAFGGLSSLPFSVRNFLSPSSSFSQRSSG